MRLAVLILACFLCGCNTPNQIKSGPAPIYVTQIDKQLSFNELHQFRIEIEDIRFVTWHQFRTFVTQKYNMDRNFGNWSTVKEDAYLELISLSNKAEANHHAAYTVHRILDLYLETHGR